MPDREVPELVFLSAMLDDEHAFCPPPCNGLMSRDGTGLLVCADCSTDALDDDAEVTP